MIYKIALNQCLIIVLENELCAPISGILNAFWQMVEMRLNGTAVSGACRDRTVAFSVLNRLSLNRQATIEHIPNQTEPLGPNIIFGRQNICSVLWRTFFRASCFGRPLIAVGQNQLKS